MAEIAPTTPAGEGPAATESWPPREAAQAASSSAAGRRHPARSRGARARAVMPRSAHALLPMDASETACRAGDSTCRSPTKSYVAPRQNPSQALSFRSETAPPSRILTRHSDEISIARRDGSDSGGSEAPGALSGSPSIDKLRDRDIADAQEGCQVRPASLPTPTS